VLRGLIPIVVAIGVFHSRSARLSVSREVLSDFKEQITDPLLGSVKPIFFAHFADIPSLRLYWFTNLLWWSLGPMLEAPSGLVAVCFSSGRIRVGRCDCGICGHPTPWPA
jgi:hypothetical protein